MELAVSHSSKRKRVNSPQFIRTAKTLLLRRRTKEAINLLRRGLNLEPHCDEAALLLAKALTAVKRLKEARPILEKMIARGHNLDAAVLLARVCLALDDTPAATEVVQQTLQIAPTDQRLIELEAKIEDLLDDTQEDRPDEQEEERSTEQHISSRSSLDTVEAEEIPTEDGPTPRPSDGLDFERSPSAPDMVSAVQRLMKHDPDDAPTPRQLNPRSMKAVSAIRPLDEADLDDMPTPPEDCSAPDIVSAIMQLVDEDPDSEEMPTPRRPIFNNLINDAPMRPAHQTPQSPPPLPIPVMDPDEVGEATPPSSPSAIFRQKNILSGVRNRASVDLAVSPHPRSDRSYERPMPARKGTSSQLVELVDAAGHVHQHRIDDSRVALPVDGTFIDIDLASEQPLPPPKGYLKPEPRAAKSPPAPQLLTNAKRVRTRYIRPWHLILALTLLTTTVGITAGLVVRQRGQATRCITSARELSQENSAQDLREALLKLREAANLIGRKANIVSLAASIHARLAVEYGESSLKGVEGLIDESLRLGAMKQPHSAEDVQVSRAYLHLAQKPLPSAIGYLLKSMEKHPDNLRIRLLYGDALAANGETFLAGRILDKLPAEQAAVLQARARLSWRRGAKTEARALLKAAGKRGLPPLHVELGLAQFQVEEDTADAATLKRLQDLLRQAHVPSRQGAWAHLLRGLIQQEQGQPQLAREALEQALTHHPAADIDFNYFVGRLLLAQHRIDHARREAHSALSRAPHDPRLITLMASIELALDRPSAALKLLFGIDEPDSKTHLLMAQAHLQQGQLDRAHQMLHLAGEATAPRRRLLLARILLAKNMPYKALGALKGMDRQSRYLPQLQLIRGLVAIKLNNNREAKRLLKETLKGDRFSIPALMNLGQLALNANQAQRALDYLERAVSIAPYDRKARVALGQLLLRLTQYSDAENEFDRAITLDSNEVAALIGRARAAIELDSKDASLYIRSVQARGHRLSAALLSARQLLVQGKLRRAASALIDLLNRSLPDRPLAELWLAQALHRQGKLDQAEDAYHTALTSKDNIPLAGLELSRIHSQRGDVWTALKYAKRANQQLPFGIYPAKVKAQVKIQLTRCYRKTKDLGAAIAELQDVLEFNKTHGEANLELGRIYQILNKRDRAVKYLIVALSASSVKRSAHRELNRICRHRATAPANCP